ncbi:uncharacterized protein LOC134217173 [Armigeres subalbatus]|uniref:uncharacterized protein LOC134217173 n=1 Tax=Armigeres subalbatus TaxID=124917 RepID=UPI002ED014FD
MLRAGNQHSLGGITSRSHNKWVPYRSTGIHETHLKSSASGIFDSTSNQISVRSLKPAFVKSTIIFNTGARNTPTCFSSGNLHNVFVSCSQNFISKNHHHHEHKTAPLSFGLVWQRSHPAALESKKKTVLPEPILAIESTYRS